MNTEKLQIGYIDYLAMPMFDLKVEFPENCVNLQTSKAEWQKRKDKYEEELRAQPSSD